MIAGDTIKRFSSSSSSHGRDKKARVSGPTVVEGVLFHVVCPCGRGHAAVGIEEDPKATYDEEPQEDEQQEHQDEGSFLF